MAILDQSKPISLYLKIKKFKNIKFVSCTIIIQKNGNQISMQPILKSNAPSFMFNNFFCEMKGKKVIHWGGAIMENWNQDHPERYSNFYGLCIKFQGCRKWPWTW